MESDSKFFELVNQGPNIQREYEDAYSKSVASEGIAKPTSKSNMKSNKILSKFPNWTFFGLGSNWNKLRIFSPSGGS